MRMTFALAALLAATAFTPAIAQDNSERQSRAERRAERGGPVAERAARPEGGWQRQRPQQMERPQRAERPEGGWSRGRQQVAPAAPVVQQQPQQQAQPVERRWNGERGMNRGAERAARPNWNGGQRDGNAAQPRTWQRGEAGRAQLGGTPVAPPAVVNREGRRWDNNQPNRNWNGEVRRNDTWRNNGQNVQRRDDRRDDNWRNQQRNGYGNNAYRPDNRNWNNGRSWNRDWRRNQQFDWQRYRTSNRDLYRARPYYAPRGWSYGYQRFSIGYSLSSILFDQRYWIEDPYAYRLPPAYEPYRWVRYYDDVLLVDLRTGEVVDTIHDFFW